MTTTPAPAELRDEPASVEGVDLEALIANVADRAGEYAFAFTRKGNEAVIRKVLSLALPALAKSAARIVEGAIADAMTGDWQESADQAARQIAAICQSAPESRDVASRLWELAGSKPGHAQAGYVTVSASELEYLAGRLCQEKDSSGAERAASPASGLTGPEGGRVAGGGT